MNGLFHSGFPTKALHSLIIASMRATLPVNLSLLDLTSQIKFGEAYKL
jgi:hypothetical protein